MKLRKILVLVLSVCFLLTGCTEKRAEAIGRLEAQQETDRHEMTTFAMDTIMDFTIYHEDGEELLIDAEQEIRRLERLLSITMEDSDISKINKNAGVAPVEVAADTMAVLTKGQEAATLTHGAFNMAISPIVKAWGFTTDGDKKVPEKETIEGLLPYTKEENIVLDGEAQTAYLAEAGMLVDLGGIAKGYTSDAVTNILREKGVVNALISLGGNISAMGSKSDGKPWKIAVENPLDANDYVGLLEVRDKSVITSGGYQRFFEENGKRYHHIIDSETGYPAESGLLSVTIISENGTMADGLSTALFVMGLEEAASYWREHKDFEAIFVTEDGDRKSVV